MYVKQKLPVSLADAVMLVLCERVKTKIHVTENYIYNLCWLKLYVHLTRWKMHDIFHSKTGEI